MFSLSDLFFDRLEELRVAQDILFHIQKASKRPTNFLIWHDLSFFLQTVRNERPRMTSNNNTLLNHTCWNLVGALELHIWLGEFVDVYFKVV